MNQKTDNGRPPSEPRTMTMTPQHQAFLADLSAHLPAERLLTDPLRTLAYGTDASFYRLVPQIVVLARSEAVLRETCTKPHTLRASSRMGDAAKMRSSP